MNATRECFGRTSRLGSLVVLGLAGLVPLGFAVAQNQQTQQPAAKMTLPPTQELLTLEVNAPDQVRVGDQVTYELKVTNVSDNVMLHDIVIERMKQQPSAQQSGTKKQAQAEKEQAEKEQAEKEQAKKEQAKKEQAKKEQGKKEQAEKEQPKKEQAKKKAQAKKEQSNQQMQGQQRQRMRIGSLKPGESKTRTIKATADQQGQMQWCFAVVSLKPVVCVQTKVVKADLEVVKQCPDTANVCEDFQYEYYVKNTGSADLQSLTVTDQLPDGVMTTEGADKLKFQVDSLEAGEVRKFVVSVTATDPGKYGSRAVAKYADGQEARSKKVSTTVEAAQLAVAIDGPRRTYVGEPMDFTIRVTNNGDAPAPDAQLELEFPQHVSLTGLDDPYSTDQKVAQNISQQNGQPTEAKQQSQQEKQAKKEQAKPQQDGGPMQGVQTDQEYWDLGDLQPGQSMAMQVQVSSDEEGNVPLKAVASYDCAVAEDVEDAQLQVKSTAHIVAKVLAIPALRLSVVDENDPVPVGEQVTYTIRIKNQGEAPAKQVEVNAELPEEMKFNSADGSTEVQQQQGQTVQFEPIESISAGEQVEYQVVATVQKAGDLRLNVEVTSKDFAKPITVQEPTNAYEPGQTNKQ